MPCPKPDGARVPEPAADRASSLAMSLEALVADIRVRSEPRIADTSHKYGTAAAVRHEAVRPRRTCHRIRIRLVPGSAHVIDRASLGLGRGGRPGRRGLGSAQATTTARQFRMTLSPPHCPASRGRAGMLLARPDHVQRKALRLQLRRGPGPEWIAPDWLWAVGQGPFIVGPSEVRLTPTTGAYGEHYRGIELVRDPKGRFPTKLPIGTSLGGRRLEHPASRQDHRHVRPPGRPDLPGGLQPTIPPKSCPRWTPWSRSAGSSSLLRGSSSRRSIGLRARQLDGPGDAGRDVAVTDERWGFWRPRTDSGPQYQRSVLDWYLEVG